MGFRKFLHAVALVLLAGGVGPAFSAVWQWSSNAALDATIDPTINWAEGMSPSSVNDSARAMMARVSEYRDDISGRLVAGGTSSAYTVATNQGLASVPTDGQMLAITVASTNVGGATLQADGGTIYPILASSLPIPSGVMIAGSTYSLKFSSGSVAWTLRDFYGAPSSVPIGAMVPFTGDASPSSTFVIPTGQCISRTTYAAYFSLVGTRFSVCDGTTTFGVIDMRGRGPWGLDNMNGSPPANRMTASATGCGTSFGTVGVSCGNESQTLTTAQMPSHNHSGTTGTENATHTHGGVGVALANSTGNIPGGGGFAYSLTIGSSATESAPHAHGIPSDGGGGAHPIVPPVIGVTYLLRIL